MQYLECESVSFVLLCVCLWNCGDVYVCLRVSDSVLFCVTDSRTFASCFVKCLSWWCARYSVSKKRMIDSEVP